MNPFVSRNHRPMGAHGRNWIFEAESFCEQDAIPTERFSEDQRAVQIREKPTMLEREFGEDARATHQF